MIEVNVLGSIFLSRRLYCDDKSTHTVVLRRVPVSTLELCVATAGCTLHATQCCTGIFGFSIISAGYGVPAGYVYVYVYVYSRTQQRDPGCGMWDPHIPYTVDPLKGTVEDHQSVSSPIPKAPKPKTRYTHGLSTTVHTSTSYRICDSQMIVIDVFRHNKVMSKIDFVFFRSRLNYNICLISALRPLLKHIEISPEQELAYCLFNLWGYGRVDFEHRKTLQKQKPRSDR